MISDGANAAGRKNAGELTARLRARGILGVPFSKIIGGVALLKPPDANLILREQGAVALCSVFDNTPPEPVATSVQPNTGGGAVPEIELDSCKDGPSPFRQA